MEVVRFTMIDEKLLALLACPACQGDVQLKDNKIVCTRCQRIYPIVDGIPVLLVDQAESYDERTRLKKLVEDFSRHKNIDALLIVNDSNIRYLTQFPACESWLLVTKTKAFYITDSRYILEARQGLKGISVKQYSHMPCATLCELCKQYKIKRLGFDERHTSFALWKKLKEFCPRNRKLIPATGLVESLREIKDEGEIAQIKNCLKLHFKAIDFMKKVVKPGLTERQVALQLERFVKSHGADFSFSPIIASGPNSCYPHARATDRVIRNNEGVLLDFGIDLNGYKSDLTRNFFLGRIAPRVKQVFDALNLRNVRRSVLSSLALAVHKSMLRHVKFCASLG